MDKQNLIYSTVQLRNDEREGTGVIVDMTMKENESVPVIITNKHVVADCSDIELSLTVQRDDGSYAIQECKLQKVFDKCVFHQKYDLCAIPLSLLIVKTRSMNRMVVASVVCMNEMASIEDFSKSDAISDVYVIGYPNAFRDRKNNLPIAKKGVTSTPLFADYEGRKEFLVDCGLVRGSSGSPVYIKDENGDYKLAGIICETKNMSVDAYFWDENGEKRNGSCWISTGIGIAIKAEVILDLAGIINSNLSNIAIS